MDDQWRSALRRERAWRWVGVTSALAMAGLITIHLTIAASAAGLLFIVGLERHSVLAGWLDGYTAGRNYRR